MSTEYDTLDADAQFERAQAYENGDGVEKTWLKLVT